MPLEFSKISADKLRQLPRQRTVFFFPVGPLEDHGPHLPLGLDVLEAERLCQLAAEKLERDLAGWVGVVMPPAPLGVTSNTSETRITVRGHVLRDWLVDACRSLIRSDFVHFACFTGNLGPRQLTAIEEAGKIVGKNSPLPAFLAMIGRALGHKPGARPSLVSIQSGLVPAGEVAKSPLWPDPAEHGTRRDTAVGLALGAMTAMTPLPSPRPAPASRLERIWLRFRGKTAGTWGKTLPSDATAAWGQATLQQTVDDAFPKLRAVWEGANPNFLFRSYYSVFPPNQSFFKAWILIVMIIAVLIAWLYLGLGSIGER